MDINSISQLANLGNVTNVNNQKDATPNSSFASMLNNAIGDVNKTQVEGYKAMEGIATGKVTNLQEAVQKIEEAELSLKLALEVKNKAINAYKEVMRMSV